MCHLFLSGEAGVDIELKINYPAEEVESKNFVLDGKKLRLVKPLDRDAKDLASIVFQVKLQIDFHVHSFHFV